MLTVKTPITNRGFFIYKKKLKKTQPILFFLVYLPKQLNIFIMKNYFNNLLDEVKPTTDEHKDVIYTFLGFPVILFAIIGALYCILNFMR